MPYITQVCIFCKKQFSRTSVITNWSNAKGCELIDIRDQCSNSLNNVFQKYIMIIMHLHMMRLKYSLYTFLNG